MADRLKAFFAPRSLAVVGASDNAYWGRNAITNLKIIDFDGQVVPVNPKRKTVLGIECVTSLRDLSKPVDLVYVAAPIDAVSSVLSDAGHVGIRNAVIISAGFGEAGVEGQRLQASLKDDAQEKGITILGPNCPGFINFTDGVSAYGQEIPSSMPKGSVGIILQSGALTSVILKLARTHAVGLSKVVCMGNEAIVRAVDVLEYMIADEATQVIAMFLEQIRDGDHFLQLARRALEAGKAIVVFKVGRTPEGQRAALAHTGAVAGDDAVVEAALRQSGVVRVHSLEELLITAGLLSRVPPLKGARMAVITGSGGACDIIADRASDEGLQLPSFSPGTLAELKAYLPKFATVQNPLDTAAVDTVRDTGTAATAMDVVAEIVSRDPNFDFVLYNGFNVVPQVAGSAEDQEKHTARIAHVGHMLRQSEKPIIPVSLSCMEVGPFASSLYDANDLFMLGGIEFGLKAIGHAVRWNQARTKVHTAETPRKTVPLTVLASRKGAWSEFEGRQLLDANDVPLVPATLVQTVDEAVKASESLGYPVVLKICSAAIAHKSDIGGVALNLRSADEVRTAFASVEQAGRREAGDKIDGVLVSPMRPRGVELFAGVTVDPSFGPTLAVGLGGVWIEVLRDVSLRVLPVSEADVVEMLSSLRARPLLDGARGGPKVDIAKVAQVICKIAHASLSIGPNLQAFEVNPIWALDDRVEALDVLVVTD
ncbi:acetate--CoA ligase family protein [Paraburkholderia aspalathi]|uniref:acetate--CoA ligase family protein n=1 Tax=Paraburkholderia aspalathi TaxID=1324617 RepID=UPI001BAA434F|nr:acetate--CoA ligase family protein [Paraburkholderia aspalathi]